MRQRPGLKPPQAASVKAPETVSRLRRKRLTGPSRRLQILEVAAAQFARTGLHGTTTQALAKAAGVSEPVLYAHFGNKGGIFRAAVEANIETRLSVLADRLMRIPPGSIIQSIEGMAEATVTACVSSPADAVLTNWGLLEDPEYATGLYRNEIGSVGVLWKRELDRRFPGSPSLAALSIHLGEFAVNVCAAYGFWLAALRHTEASATPLARYFATGIAQAASQILSEQDKPRRQNS